MTGTPARRTVPSRRAVLGTAAGAGVAGALGAWAAPASAAAGSPPLPAVLTTGVAVAAAGSSSWFPFLVTAYSFGSEIPVAPGGGATGRVQIGELTVEMSDDASTAATWSVSGSGVLRRLTVDGRVFSIGSAALRRDGVYERFASTSYDTTPSGLTPPATPPRPPTVGAPWQAVDVVDDAVPDRLVMAVDGNSLVHRSFHAQASTGTRTPDGRPIWAVRGLLGQLVAAVERLDPDVVVVGFDDPSDSWRKQEWPGYKGTRTEKLETLVVQLARAIDVLRALGITVVVPPGLEADDVLASTAACAAAAGARTVVVSSDRDAFALIDSRTSVLRILNGGVEASPLLTPDRLHLLLGIRAGQYGDFAALRGDSSDNLAGVQGIGPKTAAKLLGALGSARAAFDDLEAGGSAVLDAIGKGATARLAAPGAREAWERNRAVMRMRTDVEVPLTAGLPLAEADVREVYTEHLLTSTLPSALRTLSRVDVPGPVVTRAWSDAPRTSSGPNWGRPARPAPLPRRRDEGQLSLF